MPLKKIDKDITLLQVDAIVNAANDQLSAGGGVCGAIFRGAGKDLHAACREIGYCPTGEAVITFGYNLKAKYIIHAVGPIWRGGESQEKKLLTGAYRSSLELAVAHDCKSIAFPLISSGIYGYPKSEAFNVAVLTIGEFLVEKADLEVYLSIFTKKQLGITPELIEELKMAFPRVLNSVLFQKTPLASPLESQAFLEYLLEIIKNQSLTLEEISRRANLPWGYFGNLLEKPSLLILLALAIVLGLDLQKTRILLDKAGYTLNEESFQHKVVAAFIERNETNFFWVNLGVYAFTNEFLF
ncbi:MAG: macro domain-containing protein [Deltaproteobacteria bacterium]|jgi:O-acetyl-ADP-ribose deacetylase (regulator of RNase III)|nr:macro domain-containing protein [Deltaproteobacteria bacterium]